MTRVDYMRVLIRGTPMECSLLTSHSLVPVRRYTSVSIVDYILLNATLCTLSTLPSPLVLTSKDTICHSPTLRPPSHCLDGIEQQLARPLYHLHPVVRAARPSMYKYPQSGSYSQSRSAGPNPKGSAAIALSDYITHQPSHQVSNQDREILAILTW